MKVWLSYAKMNASYRLGLMMLVLWMYVKLILGSLYLRKSTSVNLWKDLRSVPSRVWVNEPLLFCCALYVPFLECLNVKRPFLSPSFLGLSKGVFLVKDEVINTKEDTYSHEKGEWRSKNRILNFPFLFMHNFSISYLYSQLVASDKFPILLSLAFW